MRKIIVISSAGTDNPGKEDVMFQHAVNRSGSMVEVSFDGDYRTQWVSIKQVKNVQKERNETELKSFSSTTKS